MIRELTYEEAAIALHCSPRHVRRLLKEHSIKPHRIGHRTVRIPAGEIGKLVIKLLPDPPAPKKGVVYANYCRVVRKQGKRYAYPPKIKNGGQR